MILRTGGGAPSALGEKQVNADVRTASLGLLPIIIADRDVGEALRNRYVTKLPDTEMAETLRAYFECDMHVGRTAQLLYLHPNTLRYRLSRFEHLTGTRLRDVGDAMDVWWALSYESAVVGTTPDREVVDTPQAGVLHGLVKEAVRRSAHAVPLFADPAVTDEVEVLAASLVRSVFGDQTLGDDEAVLASIGARWAKHAYSPADLAAACQVLVAAVMQASRDARPASAQRCNALVTALLHGNRIVDHLPTPASFLRAVLLGPGDSRAWLDALHFGLQPRAKYCAVHGRPSDGGDPEELAHNYGLRIDGTATPTGMATMLGADLIGLVAARADLAPGQSGILGIGPSCPIHRLTESFRLASRALDTAVRHGRSGAQPFNSLGSWPALWAGSAVNEALAQRYLTPLGHGEKATKIVDTVHSFLMANRNVLQAAKHLLVHPNTVRHRVNRFESLVGVSLRHNTAEVFEVWWTLRHRRTGWSEAIH